MTQMIVILVSAVLVNNFVLARFYGICSFLGVSNKLSSSVGMGAAVTFVMVMATLATYPLYTYVLVPLGITYLDNMSFVVVIALLVQIVEMVLKKYMPPLYRALGVYLPLIVTNCAVLGVAFLNITNEYSYVESLVYSAGAGLGFLIAMVLFSGVRSRIEEADVPAAFKGVPATLIAASITALSFAGFGGMV